MNLSKRFATRIGSVLTGPVTISTDALGVGAYGEVDGLRVRLADEYGAVRALGRPWAVVVDAGALGRAAEATRYSGVSVDDSPEVAPIDLPDIGDPTVELTMSTVSAVRLSRNQHDLVAFEPFGGYLKAGDKVVVTYKHWDRWPFRIPRAAFALALESSYGRVGVVASPASTPSDPARRFVITTGGTHVWGLS